MFAGCMNQMGKSAPTPSSTGSTGSPATSSRPAYTERTVLTEDSDVYLSKTQQHARCVTPKDKPYTSDGSCRQYGEIVAVTRVVDGDTIEVEGGRTIRLLGIDAPEAKTCAGPGATEAAKARIGSALVKLVQEPGVDRDKYQRELRYVALDGPFYTQDLGNDLTLGGWAKPYVGGEANAEYMAKIQQAYEIAMYRPEGMYAKCEKPKVFGDDDRDGIPDYDAPNGNVPNLPDGSLTGGYCARKWWC